MTITDLENQLRSAHRIAQRLELVSRIDKTIDSSGYECHKETY